MDMNLSTGNELGLSHPSALQDPLLKSVGNTRLIRAMASISDPKRKQSLLNARILSLEDYVQAEEILKRRSGVLRGGYLPLFDRVLVECEDVFAGARAYLLRQALPSISSDSSKEGFFQFSLTSSEVESIIGSLETDLVRSESDGKLDDAREHVERVVGLSTATSKQKLKFVTRRIIEAFRRHTHSHTSIQNSKENGPDISPELNGLNGSRECGSIPIQSAILTLRIRNLLRHLLSNPQDTRTRVLVERLCHRRRRMLDHLRGREFGRYMPLIRDLGLMVV